MKVRVTSTPPSSKTVIALILVCEESMIVGDMLVFMLVSLRGG